MPVDGVPQGVLAGDIPVEALGDGVVDHDLRIAGEGDVLDNAFFVIAGTEGSFLGFAD